MLSALDILWVLKGLYEVFELIFNEIGEQQKTEGDENGP